MLTDNFFFSFSHDAQSEIYHIIKSQNESLSFSIAQNFSNEVEKIRTELEKGNRFIIIRPLHNFLVKYSYDEQIAIHWLIGIALGEPVVQNEEGEKAVLVYDRDKTNSVGKGARYHQTHEGGIFHTDNVNVPYKWHYLLFGCLSPSYVGGESIIVNGNKIHELLRSNFPSTLRILEEDFLWEQRGMKEVFNKAPIISYDEHAEVEFRYLRPYMEAAHLKYATPLTEEQSHALDTFEALLEQSENQYRHVFSKGEILLTYDSQILHDRTRFTDHPDAITLDDWKSEDIRPIKRTMNRIWLKKKN